MCGGILDGKLDNHMPERKVVTFKGWDCNVNDRGQIIMVNHERGQLIRSSSRPDKNGFYTSQIEFGNIEGSKFVSKVVGSYPGSDSVEMNLAVLREHGDLPRE